MPDIPTPSRTMVRRVVFSALLLSVLAVLPYIGGWRHALVYDDHGQIAENPFLESSGRWTAVWTLRTLNDPAIVNGRRPAVLLTYLADRALWGRNPAGLRSTNYLFHAASVLLLYLLIVRIARRKDPMARGNNWFAFMAALLWAWHPAMVESVHVPAFRPDLMVAGFGLLAMHSAMGMRDDVSRLRNVWPALMALIGVAGAMLSKESGITAPVLIGWCWFCFPYTRPSRGQMAALLLSAAGWVFLFVVLCARSGPDGVAPPSLQAIGAEWNGRSLLYPHNLFTLPWLWWSYVRILLLPVPLIVDRVVDPVQSLFAGRFVVGMLVLLAALGAWGASIRRGPSWIGFGIGVMWIGFAPVSNAVPLLNPMAERYMPLMVMGFAVALAWCLAGPSPRVGRTATVRLLILAILLVGYCIVGALRVQDFRDDDILWLRTLRDEPNSARAHTWVGLSLQQQDRLDEAVEHFGRARVLNPYDLTPRINKAILYGRLGQLDEAERMLREAVAIRPSFAPAHWNLAVALQYQGRMAEALEVLNETLRLDPYHIEARKARIVLHVDREGYDDALRDAEQLMRLMPDDPESRAARAYLFERVRGMQDAL